MEIHLNQLIQFPKELPRTISPPQWASAYGFQSDGTLLVITAEHVQFIIDPLTGRSLNRDFF